MIPYGGYAGAELPELYDSIPLYHSRPDVSFYVDLCRRASGGVLDLGCGTGRVLIPAAEKGCIITGVDQSADMLARCRAKIQLLPDKVQERITLVRGDMTNFRLRRKFELVIVPFRPLQHLITVDEQLRFLGSVAKHLAPKGKLVFDVYHVEPHKTGGPVNPDETEDTPEMRISGGRTLRRTFRILAKRRAEQCNDIELIYRVRYPNGEARRIVQTFSMRYFYRYELEHLLVRAGFRMSKIYGDFDKSAFTDQSPEMIITAVRS